MDRALRMKSEENNFKNKETSKGTSGKNKKYGGNCGGSSNYVFKKLNKFKTYYNKLDD